MKNKKGFTLAELLIVVAIIAVLVAVAIPVFGAQLESSREAVDVSALRTAYAEGMYMLIDGSYKDLHPSGTAFCGFYNHETEQVERASADTRRKWACGKSTKDGVENDYPLPETVFYGGKTKDCCNDSSERIEGVLQFLPVSILDQQ